MSLPIAVGVEIADAGTRLAAVLSANPGARRWHTRLPAPPEPHEAVAAIDALVGRALTESGLSAGGKTPPVALGVAVWGEVDAAGTVVRALPPAPAWRTYPLAERLGERFGGITRLLPATSAGALAEHRAGAGMGSGQLLYVLVGRSVTCAIVSRGQLVRGAHGSEGMLAHMRVTLDGPRCSCGVVGHLEPIASAQSIVRAMIGRASGSDESTAAMLRASGGRAEAMSVAQVARLAAEGEPAAIAVMTAALDALSVALANSVALLDPDRIVLAGPLAAAGDDVLDPVRERLAALVVPFAYEPPAVVVPQLDPLAPLIGAWLLAADLAAGADARVAGSVS